MAVLFRCRNSCKVHCAELDFAMKAESLPRLCETPFNAITPRRGKPSAVCTQICSNGFRFIKSQALETRISTITARATSLVVAAPPNIGRRHPRCADRLECCHQPVRRGGLRLCTAARRSRTGNCVWEELRLSYPGPVAAAEWRRFGIQERRDWSLDEWCCTRGDRRRFVATGPDVPRRPVRRAPTGPVRQWSQGMVR